jgi:hypothetical protein
MNLVLGDAEEFRKLPPKKGKSEDEVSPHLLHAQAEAKGSWLWLVFDCTCSNSGGCQPPPGYNSFCNSFCTMKLSPCNPCCWLVTTELYDLVHNMCPGCCLGCVPLSVTASYLSYTYPASVMLCLPVVCTACQGAPKALIYEWIMFLCSHESFYLSWLATTTHKHTFTNDMTFFCHPALIQQRYRMNLQCSQQLQQSH